MAGVLWVLALLLMLGFVASAGEDGYGDFILFISSISLGIISYGMILYEKKKEPYSKSSNDSDINVYKKIAVRTTIASTIGLIGSIVLQALGLTQSINLLSISIGGVIFLTLSIFS